MSNNHIPLPASKPLRIAFSVPFLPPSFNKSFQINYNFREVSLSPEARAFKQKVKMSIAPSFTIPDNPYFKIHITYSANWFYKNNKPRKLDLQNLDKILIDAIFEQIGWDDSRIWEAHFYKKQGEENRTDVVLEICPI